MKRSRILQIIILIILLSILGIFFITNIANKNNFDEKYNKNLTLCLKNKNINLVQKCITKVTPKINSLKDLKDVVNVLNAREKNSPDFTSRCHYSAHLIGFNLDPKYIELSIKNNIRLETCTYGILHGFLENYSQKPHSTNDTEKLLNLCIEIKDEELSWQCSHSMGHELWLEYQDYNKVVEICNLEERYYNIISCTVGGYMESYFPTIDKFLKINKKMPLEEIISNCTRYETHKYSIKYNSCLEGSFYITMHDKFYAINKIQLDKYKFGEKVSSDDLQTIKNISKEASNLCNLYKGKARTNCMRVGWVYLTQLDGWIFRDDTVRGILCSPWEPTLYNVCRESKSFPKYDVNK